MPTISQLVVAVTANTAQFQAGMAKAAATTKATTGAMGTSVSKFGGMAGLAWGIAGVAAVKFAADAVNAASDQNEALNKSQVVFADSADAVSRFAETSARSFGISKTAALSAASGFGAVLQTAGLTEQASADMSVSLTKLGADMASFNNISVDEALLKLKSGLAGEAEPLRAVGVLLSENRVKQEAYASGIARTGAELTEGQKVQARYNLILQDTAKQQGDFARTSDGLANQQRILRAEFEDLQAKLGQQLLPVIVDVVDAFSELLTLISGTDIVEGANKVADLTKQWDAGAISVREYLTQLDELQDVYNISTELSGELFEKLQQEAEGIDMVSRAHGSYFGATTASVGATEDLATAAEEATAELRDERNAMLALVNDEFALMDARNQVTEAQRTLTQLERKGKEGTRAYDEAVYNVILTTAAYEQALLDLAIGMEGVAKEKEIIATIKELGREGVLTKEQIQGVIDTLLDLDGMHVNASIGVALQTWEGSINRGFGGSGSGGAGGGGAGGGPPVGGGPNERARVVVTLDRRRFADALDFDTVYRGW